MKLVKINIVFVILFLMCFITFKNSISLIGSKLNLLSSVTNGIDDFSEEDDSKENEKAEKELKYLFSESMETIGFISLLKEEHLITKDLSLPSIFIVPETPPPSVV